MRGNSNPAAHSDPRLRAVADRIRWLRAARGWSAQQLADAIPCPRETITRVENAWNYPTLRIVLDIADALNIAPAALFAGPRPILTAAGSMSPSRETPAGVRTESAR